MSEVILTQEQQKEIIYHAFFDPLDEDGYNPEFIIIERKEISTDKQTLQTNEELVIKRNDGALFTGMWSVTKFNNKVIKFPKVIVKK